MLEGFEDVARLYFEGQGYIVSGSVSIPFVGDKETKRRERQLAAVGPTDPAIQIDLVAARADELVICEVKSWFKSTGLVFDRHFSDDPSGREIKLFRNEQYRNYVARNLAKRFRYKFEQVSFALVSGKARPADVPEIREHFKERKWLFLTSADIAKSIVERAMAGHYVNDSAVAMIRCLEAAELLKVES